MTAETLISALFVFVLATFGNICSYVKFITQNLYYANAIINSIRTTSFFTNIKMLAHASLLLP